MKAGKRIRSAPRRARSDSRLKRLYRRIERRYGLPRGAIKMTAPNGRTVRSDATVGRLRKLYKNAI